jgi:hypothetical protein
MNDIYKKYGTPAADIQQNEISERIAPVQTQHIGSGGHSVGSRGGHCPEDMHRISLPE